MMKIPKVLRLFLLLCCLSFLGSIAFAQSNNAVIVGSVLDSDGAAVPNAQVIITNQGTGISSKATTTANGQYTATYLEPGTYSVSVMESGFQGKTMRNITLFINQTARVDVSLHVGDVSTHVEVNATSPIVQSETSSVGEVVDSRQVTQMPLDGRSNILNLLALAPGVQSTSVGQNPAISGGTWFGSTNETVDGVSNNDIANERLAPAAPSLEAIEEFKVIANGSSAEFGHGGAQVLIETKSGTNTFHGSLFEFNRNRVLAAKNWYATSQPLPPYNRNEFGGSFGGPLLKDKLFFFGSFESLHLLTSRTNVTSLPTAAMKTGDFTGLPTIYMPGTSTPFLGNQIDPSLISPVATALLKFSTDPNLPGIGNNFVYNSPTYEKDNRYSGRIDYQLTSTDKISARYYYAGDGPYLNGTGGSTDKYGNYSGFGATDQNLGITYTRTISANMVNQTIAGFQQVRDFRIPQNFNYDPTTIIPGLTLAAAGLGGLPTVTITGYTGFFDQAGSADKQRDLQILDNLSWVLGRHSLKAGFEFQRVNDRNLLNPAPARGSFAFNGVYTGNAFADFLLGDTNATSKTTETLLTEPQDNRYAAFVQDDMTYSPNLTLNLGLRWEYQSPFQNGTGNLANFYPGIGLVLISGTPNPILAGLPIVNGENVGINTSNYVNKDFHNFAPRIGFAYRPFGNGNFVVSSSYGIFYNVIGGYVGPSNLPNNPPFQTIETYTALPGNIPSLTFANPFPATGGAITANPVVNAVSRNRVNGYMQQWNLTVEGEVLRNTALRASYIGNKGTHLDEQRNLNDPGPAPGVVQPRRPYQPWSTVNYYTSDLTSNMNQLELGAVRRITTGISFGVQYQFTREFTFQPYGLSAPTDPSNPALDYGNADFIRRNYVAINYTYDLPFGKGRHFVLSGPANILLGRWQLAGIATAGTGQPFSVTFTSKVVGWPSSRANLIGNTAGNHTIKEWFNPAAFTLPAPYTYGTSQRNSLFGPGLVNWDQAIFKTLNIKDRYNLEFRAEFFNILNHPNFDVPSSDITVPATVGHISDTVNNPRDIQLAIRLSF